MDWAFEIRILVKDGSEQQQDAIFANSGENDIEGEFDTLRPNEILQGSVVIT